MDRDKSNKTSNLVLGILFDIIGMLSLTLPIVGDFIDIIWAPIAAFLMTKMYSGDAGKIAALLCFIEEILPLTDIIPSFTLMWYYTYYLKDSMKKANIKLQK